MNTITKREMFAALMGLAQSGSMNMVDFNENITDDMVVEFCEKEIASLDKKAAKAKETASKKKAASDELTDVVYDVLSAEEFMTTADVVLAINNEDVTTSKVTYRLSQLEKAGRAEKSQVEIPATETSKKRKAVAYRKLV